MNRASLPVVLAIAGSDSGGGAGIQADLKTITMLGAYAATAITAITAQNTQGVQAVQILPPDLVVAQIRSVLDDLGAQGIKIGMLGNAKLIRAVAMELQNITTPIVLDPVMIAKGGAALLPDDAVSALRDEFVPLADLLTPNIPEAEALTGLKIIDLNGQRQAAAAILDLGAKAVLVKGGHMSGDLVRDLLLWGGGEAVFESPRVHTRHTHGTGCTLASAIATWLAHGLQLEEAVRLARSYVQGAIKNAPELGKGHGPLGHNWQLPGNRADKS